MRSTLKNTISLAIIMCFFTLCEAQKNNIEPHTHNESFFPSRLQFVQHKINENRIEDEILSFLSNEISVNHSVYPLQLENQINSKTGRYYTYSMWYNNIRIQDFFMKVCLGNDGYIRSYSTNVPPNFNANASNIYQQQTNTAFNRRLLQPYEPYTIHHQEEVLIYDANTNIFDRGYALQIFDPSRDFYTNILMGESELVRVLDDRQFYAPPSDTTISAYVFMPDPITSSNNTYDPPYVDNNDSTNIALDNERISIEVEASFNTGTFFLENDIVKIDEFSPPVVPPVTQSNSQFMFDRSESGFEDVNAFYHLTTYQEYLQSIGFTNLMPIQLIVDAHGFDGEENSSFTTFPTPRLTFGVGGVDDAEDADVILHEYGHALSFFATLLPKPGAERNGIDEGFGDYIASSYSRHISEYRWDDVFNWDGHNEFWPGRTSSSQKTLEDLNLTYGIYYNGEIWASTLMDIWEEFGREITDNIVFESIYGYFPNMTFIDAAELLLDAEEALYGGDYRCSLYSILSERKFLDETCIDGTIYKANEILFLNSLGFAKHQERLKIVISEHSFTWGKYELFNVQGQKLMESQQSSNRILYVDSGTLPTGVYIVRVTTNRSRCSFKVLKHD